MIEVASILNHISGQAVDLLTQRLFAQLKENQPMVQQYIEMAQKELSRLFASLEVINGNVIKLSEDVAKNREENKKILEVLKQLKDK